MSVYIVTRSRYDNLRKIVPRWLDQDIPVVLVVERSEQPIHDRLIANMAWKHMVQTISPDRNNRGVGYARMTAVEHASEHRLRSIIMSDDDLRPAMNSDMSLLLKEARSPRILGIGAVRGIHDRFTGGAISRNSGVILCPGGWGMQVFALNIRNTLRVGNFDHWLDCYQEDHELMRNGIAAGIPWAVHCDVYVDPIGKRYEPGGLASYTRTSEERSRRELACHNLVHSRWPGYISQPGKKIQVYWQRLLDDYIPDWRARSAIHGGSWDR